MSVCPHGTTRLPLDGFLWIFICEDFLKMCWENSNFIKIWRVKGTLHEDLWQYLTELFLEWEMFQTKVVDKIKTHILCSITFFRKSCCVWGNVEEYGRVRQATDDNMTQKKMCFAFWKTNARIQTHTLNIQYLLLLHSKNGYMNAPQCYVICTLPMLRYMYIACLVFNTLTVPKWLGCGWMTRKCGFHSQQEHRFLTSSVSRLAVWPMQPGNG
jgi:hypothetical protein